MISTIVLAAHLAACHGRADFTQGCMKSLNQQVAQMLHVEPLREPEIIVTDKPLPGLHGHIVMRNGRIIMNPARHPVKNFHIVHEILHGYHDTYRFQSECTEEQWVQHMTSRWCEANNCPVWTFDGCERGEQK